jgi:hypothetical protein
MSIYFTTGAMFTCVSTQDVTCEPQVCTNKFIVKIINKMISRSRARVSKKNQPPVFVNKVLLGHSLSGLSTPVYRSGL